MKFNLFKKGSPISIYAPVDGEIIPLEEVPDPVFSQKMIGEGVAIYPSGGKILAPVEGKIIQVAPSKHALGILAEDGSEILIHIGLETVSLKGEGFTALVAEGDQVSVGLPLMEVDWEFIKEHADSTVTPIVMTNGSDKQINRTNEKTAIAGKTVILLVQQERRW
ncbi:PTS sugar transporter subunit IIA [Neobacillus sp. LXY-1]|uniref:PTS sugar transporter subunit IIA n=1 Tax=Neobacillus sp. LXY-1 TaxID=3379133 RepID=UPI003EE1BA87